MNCMKIINDPSELRIGDEIITNAGSELRYYRIIEVLNQSLALPSFNLMVNHKRIKS